VHIVDTFEKKGCSAVSGRQVFAEEEWQQFPQEVKSAVNTMRELNDMPPVT